MDLSFFKSTIPFIVQILCSSIHSLLSNLISLHLHLWRSVAEAEFNAKVRNSSLDILYLDQRIQSTDTLTKEHEKYEGILDSCDLEHRKSKKLSRACHIHIFPASILVLGSAKVIILKIAVLFFLDIPPLPLQFLVVTWNPLAVTGVFFSWKDFALCLLV